MRSNIGDIYEKPRRKPKKLSLRAAINEKCKDCIYDPASGLGTWRQQVGACTSPDCSLYPVRPMPTRKEKT